MHTRNNEYIPGFKRNHAAVDEKLDLASSQKNICTLLLIENLRSLHVIIALNREPENQTAYTVTGV